MKYLGRVLARVLKGLHHLAFVTVVGEITLRFSQAGPATAESVDLRRGIHVFSRGGGVGACRIARA